MAKYEDTLILKDKVSGTMQKIVLNFGRANKKLEAINKKTEKLENNFKHLKNVSKNVTDFGNTLNTRVTLPAIAAGGAMVKLASDMQETMNKVDVSFGKSTDKVKEWSKTSITQMGLARQTALDSAALYGDMATGMGFTHEKAAELATTLTQLGADLASFKNISNDMAQTALKSIFTGETESLKNLGIVMTQTNLEEYAYRKGLLKTISVEKKNRKGKVTGHKLQKQHIKDLTQTQQVMLRYNYVMSMTKNAQGDFARTGAGAANQTRMFQEQIKELGTQFGDHLLPYFTEGVTTLNGILKEFGNLNPEAQKSILKFLAFAAVIGPVITITGALSTSVINLNLGLGLLNTRLAAIGITAKLSLGSLTLWAGAIWGVVKAFEALSIITGHVKEMNRINNIDSIRTNNITPAQMKKLKAEYGMLGKDSFSAKYGKNVTNAVSSSISNNTTTNNTNNNGNTYNFNGSFGTGSSGSLMLDNILQAHNNMSFAGT